MSARIQKALVGRTIVKAEPNTSWEGEGSNRVRMHNWELTLDNGRMVRFMVEEHPDGAEYGIDIVLVRMRRGLAVKPKLTEAQHEMLRRCLRNSGMPEDGGACVEREALQEGPIVILSPSKRKAALAQLERKGFIAWAGAWVATDKGRAAFRGGQ